MSAIQATAQQMENRRGLAFVCLLTLFAVAVHGFHPYAEDGGLYIAGILKLLDPTLYPAWTEFVTEHLRFSLFAPILAALVRGLHLPLPYVLLGVYCLGIWATLYAAWRIALRIASSAPARCGAVALLACWLTLPIAGTSLILMDPYVTARSLSTPLILLAIAWALESRRKAWTWCAVSLILAALLHPLMAGYGAAAIAVLACVGSPAPAVRRWGIAVLGAGALTLAALLQAHAAPESQDYLRIAMTRFYWFPGEWHGYEQFGLLAPLLVLALLERSRKDGPARTLARAAIVLGLIAILVAVLFCHEHFATHVVARLQPLRAFQIVYEGMTLLLGAWIGDRILKTQPWRWALLLIALGGTMFAVQRATYPNSAHIEWPWMQPVNPWEQAFLWIRANTPKSALFALDAHYITLGTHEDAQCFRAIAQRSALADYSKDGGEASITPTLTSRWVQAQTAQTGLEQVSDRDRLKRLLPLGVDWVVLETKSATSWNCPYANLTVKVCRVPRL